MIFGIIRRRLSDKYSNFPLLRNGRPDRRALRRLPEVTNLGESDRVSRYFFVHLRTLPKDTNTPDNGITMRNRRPAQRRQVDAVQLSVERQGAGGEFSFLYDRTQRRASSRCPTSGSSNSRENRQPEENHPHDDRDRRYSRSGQGRVAKARGWATSFWPTSARRTRSSTCCSCFENDNITHVDGTIDPVRDKEIIDTELQLKDLETVENRIGKVQQAGRHGRQDGQTAVRHSLALQSGARTGQKRPDRRTRQGGPQSGTRTCIC